MEKNWTLCSRFQLETSSRFKRETLPLMCLRNAAWGKRQGESAAVKHARLDLLWFKLKRETLPYKSWRLHRLFKLETWPYKS